MKNVILFFVSVVSFWTSSQKKATIIDKNGEITSFNIVEEINEQVKHYPKEPVYHVYVKNSLCLYEVLVNDFPIGKMFDYAQQATPYDMNSEILKSGKQKITLRLYPASEEYSRSGDVLSPNTLCNLEIEYIDNKDPNHKSIPIATLKLPTKIRMAGEHNDMAIPEFEGAGKKYYEITYEFDTTVPYENEGWKKGQDLTKLDQKLLEKKVIEFYNSYKENYNQKKTDLIANNEYNLMSRDAIAQYQDKNKISKIWNERLNMIKVEKNWLPFDYKMNLYGNGKIIALLQKSDSDVRLRGESALAFTYKNDGVTYARFLGVYLYLPEGKKLEDGLEVIR